jgi:hypothetical protein
LATQAGFAGVVINEIMADPTKVIDANGEWLEFYNTGDSSVNINGWVLKDAGSDSHTISNGGALWIASGGYIVLGVNGNSGTNGGVTVDYQYSGFQIANVPDEIILMNGAVEVDRIDYGAGWPLSAGKSMELSNPWAGETNAAALWARATTTYGSGDYGTPGSANSNMVPEPASADQFGGGLAVLLSVRRRRRAAPRGRTM